MSIKLSKYEKLPSDRKFLAAMPIQEIFQAAAIILNDPFHVWEICNDVWRPNFFEKVVLKYYGSTINENSDVNFSNKMNAF
jgi:hypothetical protein